MPEENAATDREYQHPENVQRQIAGLPPLGCKDFWLRAQIVEDDSETQLAAETLVYCLRQFLARGDVDSARQVAVLLLPRCVPIIVNQAKKWSLLSERDFDDMRQEVHLQLWKELCDPRERFWEVRFYRALWCLCFDVAKQQSRVQKEEDPWPHYTDEEGDSVEVDMEDPDPIDPSEQVYVEQTLGRLDEPIRTAVYLRIIEEWPIHSQDPSNPTISSVLGVTDRTVRNYLKRGLAELHEWYVKEVGNATTY